VQGLQLLKDLAELERKLAKKLDEARQSAEQRVTHAEEEAKRILDTANTETRKMSNALKEQIAQESERYAQEAQTLGKKEGQRIRQQSDPGIERAVEYVLSEVLP